MDQGNENSVVDQVATVENQSHMESTPNVQNPPADDRQERNWKAFRERQKQLEDELRMQQEVNRRLLQLQPMQAPPAVDELDSIADDEFLDKGKIQRLIRKEAEKIAKSTVHDLRKEQEKNQFKERLERQFSDFNQVVNSETLSLLEMQDPELAGTIADIGDPYKMALQSYKYIKAMGLSIPESKQAKEVEKKLLDNAKTIQSPQVFDKRPMAQAFDSLNNPADRKALHDEMMKYARSV